MYTMSELPPLPNFFIVGAARAGTTSLARYLGAHPQAFIPWVKEVDFFDREDHYKRGVEWYRKQFSDFRGEKAIGDASPYYMFIPAAIPRMAALLPGARLIVLLRHPVDRAYSHYWLRRSYKTEKRDFRTAVTEESAGTARVPTYLAGSMYCAQLRHICEHYPRDALHIALFEDLMRDPRSVFADACRFLEIDSKFVPPNLGLNFNPTYSFKSVRVWFWLNRWRQQEGFMRPLVLALDRLNLSPFRYPRMDAVTRAALLDWFREPNRQLEEWLGRKLPEWER